VIIGRITPARGSCADHSNRRDFPFLRLKLCVHVSDYKLTIKRDWLGDCGTAIVGQVVAYRYRSQWASRNMVIVISNGDEDKDSGGVSKFNYALPLDFGTLPHSSPYYTSTVVSYYFCIIGIENSTS